MTEAPNLFPACYFPPITWFVAALTEKIVYVDTQQPYRKQRLSSRTHIKVSNRVMPLTIPVKRRSHQLPISEKEISYQEKWQHQHWQSLVSAYNASPYFEYYAPMLASLYQEQPESLLDFLSKTMLLSSEWLGIEVKFCHEKVESVGGQDYRQSFDPTRRTLPEWYSIEPYPQVFDGFEPGLSILDLMCNLGPESGSYLLSSFRNDGEKEGS